MLSSINHFEATVKQKVQSAVQVIWKHQLKFITLNNFHFSSSLSTNAAKLLYVISANHQYVVSQEASYAQILFHLYPDLSSLHYPPLQLTRTSRKVFEIRFGGSKRARKKQNILLALRRMRGGQKSNDKP